MQQVAGNIGLINPLVFNHFGYGTYAQVKMKQAHQGIILCLSEIRCVFLLVQLLLSQQKRKYSYQRGYEPQIVQQSLTAQKFG